MEDMILNTLEVVLLSAKQVDAILGHEAGLLRAGKKVLVTPFGEKEHSWSTTIKGAALRSYAKIDGAAPQAGWVSVSTLAGGTGLKGAMKDIPADGEWRVSEDGSIEYAASTSTVERISFGLALSGIPDAVKKEADVPLNGVIVIDVLESDYGYTGAVHRIGTPRPRKMWASKAWWKGAARWATLEDLEEFGVSEGMKALLNPYLK